MTYTFKLSRRLAVSRRALPVLVILAACSGGDATAPEGTPAENTTGTGQSSFLPVMVRVTPSNVTAETNQLIQFSAQGHNDAGESVGAPVVWKTSRIKGH